MIGSVLDKYEVLQKIGEGGMATVYRGRHTTLGRDVAIKVLHPHLSRSERNRRRFAREARAIENLDHDNILKIFDYSGTDTEDCYIVTEFVDGATLQALVTEHGRIPSEVAAIIGARLAEALGYAHELGIIHRDLKPENVMLRRDGAVKLMDFGIARFLDEVNLTVTGALVGSPAYMSPEQAMERVLDPRSDLFSLGTLLFHLVTGQLPFSGSNPSIILRNIIEGNRPEVVEVAPEASGSVADVIERLLQSDVNDRPRDCAVVQAALLSSLAEVGIDPAEARWELRSWLEDPGAYEARLREHLGGVLLADGKRRLDAGDHLGALRQFNRLLSIDEENEEVLDLVQGMHTAGEEPPRRPLKLVGGMVGIVVAGVFTWLMWPEPPPPPAPDLTVSEPLPVPDVAPPESPVDLAPPAAEPAQKPDVVIPMKRPTDPSVGLRARPTAARPVPPKRVLAAAAQDAPETGTVLVAVKGGAWADIWIDGDKVGRTGEGAIDVQPGKHTLELRNTYAMPHRQSFEVAAGERREVLVEQLQPKLVVRLGSDVADDCVVSLDGRSRGRVADAGRALDVPEPGAAHVLELGCPDADPRRVTVGPGATGDVVEVSTAELP